MNAARRQLAWIAGLVVLTLAGCSWLDGGSAGGPTPPGDTQAADFTVAALPVYRLVSNPSLLDSPSRLLVVRLRLDATGDASFAYAASDLHISLPDGAGARVFDGPRAVELLRRTTIAEADMGYLLRPGHQPGGIGAFTRSAIADMVAVNLLDNGAFAPGRPLQGYVVIDTGATLMSIEGASFEVVARRLSDGTPARYAYQIPPTVLEAPVMEQP